MHLYQYRFYLSNGKDDREPTATPRTHDVARNYEWHPQDVSVQEKQSMQRLILSRSANPLNYSEIGQVRGYLCFTHLRRMPPAMKQHESANPIDICFLVLRL